jgi:hypothetical protein
LTGRGGTNVAKTAGRARGFVTSMKNLLVQEELFLAEKIYDGGACRHERSGSTTATGSATGLGFSNPHPFSFPVTY